MGRPAALVQAMLFSTVALTTAPCPAQTANIDADIQAFQRTAHIEGATIAIVKAGAVVYARSFGQRDVGAGLAADNRTRYETGSVTKQFTAVAILALKEAGKLDLDAPLATYLATVPHAKDVTIRQLLTNTSGFPDYMAQPNIETLVPTPTTFDALIGRIAGKPLEFTPGSQFAHSNTNYLILGRVIEVVSGESWQHFAQEHLFGPAAMTDTSTIASESQLSDMARGYAYAKGETAPSTPFDESWVTATGDIITTTGDLVKWHEALSLGRIISKSDYQLLTVTPRLADGSSSNYGFGMYVSKFENEPVVMSQGDTFGFDASDLLFPDQNVRIIVLANTEDAGGDGATGIAERIYNDLFPSIASAAAQPKAVGPSVPAAEAFYAAALQRMLRLPAPAFARYGVSIDGSGHHLSLYRRGDGPFLDVGGGRPPTHLNTEVDYRNHDGRGAVKLDDGSFAATFYMGPFGGIWTTVHDWMRFGGDTTSDNDTIPQAGQNTTSLHEIAAVSSLNPGSYRVLDVGAEQCPSGSPGHMVHLVAIRNPESHPLTDATVDLQTGRFCMMRFTITSRHLSCLHICRATTELHFGDLDDYTIITDARLDIVWRPVGIQTGNTVLYFRFHDFTFPSSIDSHVFLDPKGAT